MTENSHTDPSEINKCILYSARRKNSVYESYQKLRGILKTQNPVQDLDYVDFEWKYYQYYYGSQDLAIERSPQNWSPVTLLDLPIHALERVVGNLDLVDCLALRKVSRNLRRLVDSSEIHCDRIYLHYGDRSTTIEIDYRLNLVFDHKKGGRCKVSTRNRGKRKEYRDDRNFEDAMVAEFSTFLKNPKLKIRRFEFTFSKNEACFYFINLLKSLGFKINVRSVDINTDEEDIHPILECLKPGILEDISFDADDMTVEQFDGIAGTEQWKGARKLRIDRFPWVVGIEMEKMLHFKEIRVNDIDFSDENLGMVRDTLLKSVHLESCWLGVADFEEHFGYWDEEDDSFEVVDLVEEDSIIRIFAQNFAFNAQTHRFTIPNTRDYFKVEFEKDFLDRIYALKFTKNKE